MIIPWKTQDSFFIRSPQSYKWGGINYSFPWVVWGGSFSHYEAEMARRTKIQYCAANIGVNLLREAFPVRKLGLSVGSLRSSLLEHNFSFGFSLNFISSFKFIARNQFFYVLHSSEFIFHRTSIQVAHFTSLCGCTYIFAAHSTSLYVRTYLLCCIRTERSDREHISTPNSLTHLFLSPPHLPRDLFEGYIQRVIDKCLAPVPGHPIFEATTPSPSSTDLTQRGLCWNDPHFP